MGILFQSDYCHHHQYLELAYTNKTHLQCPVFRMVWMVPIFILFNNMGSRDIR